MSGFAESQQPSPELFFETLNAYQRTQSLKGAIELDLFTAIAEELTQRPLWRAAAPLRSAAFGSCATILW